MGETAEDTTAQAQWHWQEHGTAWRGIGIYHISLTVTSRQPLLGTLVIPGNDPKLARVERTELGEALVELLMQVPNHRPEIRLLQFCLMPDHLHAIWHVTSPMPRSIREVVRGFWQGAKKLGRAYALSVAQHSMLGNEQRHSMLGNKRSHSLMGNEQSSTPSNLSMDSLFAEMPFIRPMSRRGQLHAMMNYVRLNPQPLATKRLMPGFFRVQSGIKIGGSTCAGVGNTALLLSDSFAPVHVRRWMVEAAERGHPQALRDYMNSCVLAARKGTVMVSPFISPKEKEVMAVLLREQLPFIFLADNGFRDYYKPYDSLFDACAAGRVLILSPWPYDAGKRHISRAECMALNHLAEELAQKM